MKRTGFTVSAALAALIAYSAPAAAQDVDAFLDRLKAVMTEQGTSVSWADVEQYDNDDGEPVIALTDVNVGAGGEGTVLKLVELVDVTEEGDGWRIGTIHVPEHSQRDGEATFYFSELSLDGLVIEPEGEQNAYGGPAFYDGMSLEEMAVTVKGEDVFTMSDLDIDIELPDGDEPMTFEGGAERFTANLGAADDPKTRAVAAAMGYSEISGRMDMAGEWEPASGRMALSQWDITVDDAGTIGISLEVGGYTPEFIASLRETQARMMANQGGDNSASGLAMMGLMQQLTFRSAKIRFNDDTLTNKVLEFVAQQQGARAKDISNQAKAMVPFMMMQLGNQELTAQATTAVSAFLDNPGSLVVAAMPASPVPFALLVAGAMSAPQALPQTLGVTIKANE